MCCMWLQVLLIAALHCTFLHICMYVPLMDSYNLGGERANMQS